MTAETAPKTLSDIDVKHHDELIDSIEKSDMSREDKDKAEAVVDMIANVREQLNTFETFVSRRFDEISMEVNATSQQMDFAEEEIAGKFTDIMSTLGTISFSGTGSAAANTGVELDAISKITEEAAHKILDAADRIATKINDDALWADDDARHKATEEINADISEILMACSFQDITGQRINKTLENLNDVEERLSGTLEKLGIKVDKNKAKTDVYKEVNQNNTTQDAVDNLFD